MVIQACGPVEVGHDDGDGQRDAEDAADGAQRGHQLASRGLGRDVPIAGARHRDDRPVQGLDTCYT